MYKKIIGIVSLVILFVGFGLIVSRGIQATERVECRTWKNQAKYLNDFYYTEWQKVQCNIN